MAKYKQKFKKIIFYRIHQQNNNFQNKNHSKRKVEVFQIVYKTSQNSSRIILNQFIKEDKNR